MLHGYMDHSFSNERFLHELNEEGYVVVAMDLPGHGKSSGERADIDNFHSYGASVVALQNMAKQKYPDLPIIAMGHSTGCAALLDGIFFHNLVFTKLILIAPLIRSFLWEWSKIGTAIAGDMITSLPRMNVNFTHRKQEPVKDELYIDSAPIHWVKMLYQWEKKVQALSITSNIPTHSIFAKQDTVVDNWMNNRRLKQLFTNYSWKYIPGAFHCLPQESDEIYDVFWREVKSQCTKIC